MPRAPAAIAHVPALLGFLSSHLFVAVESAGTRDATVNVPDTVALDTRTEVRANGACASSGTCAPGVHYETKGFETLAFVLSGTG